MIYFFMEKWFVEFIQYNKAGKIAKRCICELNQLKCPPLGQKVRVTLNDEKQYIGFWDTFSGFDTKIVEISKYDLDENTGELRSDNSLVTFIPTDKIFRLEAILYSNPRWGVAPTNKFTFSKPVRRDFKSDFFKNWPVK